MDAEADMKPSNRRFRGQAIVEGSIESYCSRQTPSLGVVVLCCGHCGAYSREATTLCYQDPTQCGVSHDDQWESYASTLSGSFTCPRCGVLNVDRPLEQYLHERSEMNRQITEFFKKLDEEDK